MKSLLKKTLCLFFSLSLTVGFSACKPLGNTTAKSLSAPTTTSKSESASPSASSNSTSVNSSKSTSSSFSSSSSVHVHSFTERVESLKYRKKQATTLEPAEYYYSCKCGSKGKESFVSGVLDFDYTKIDQYIDYIIKEGGPQNPFWNTEKSGPATWNYIDGCMMTSFWKLYDETKDYKYLDFVSTYMDYVVKDDGWMRGFGQRELATYNLDYINEGRILIDLYLHKTETKEKYKTALDRLYTQIEGQPRTTAAEPKGNFWHKQRYTQQIWLDGIYMAQPFYARYINTFLTEEGKTPDYSDIMDQIANVEKYMKNKETGLYYHGIDVSKRQVWADKKTGLSPNYWLRATGWYFAALSDLTAIIDKTTNPEEWATIQGYLKQAVDDLLPYMDKKTHMFYQVIDKVNADGTPQVDKNGKTNYLETSGTALIAYAILNGANTGALDSSYYEIGKGIFNGICENKLEIDASGNFVLTDICKVAGLSTERNGSFEYYLSESIVDNEAKGVAPFLMAYVEILKAENETI